MKITMYDLAISLSDNDYTRVAWIIAEYDVRIAIQFNANSVMHNIYCNADISYADMFDRIDKELCRGKYTKELQNENCGDVVSIGNASNGK